MEGMWCTLINAGQASKERKQRQRNPRQPLSIIPDWEEKRNKGLEGKRKHKERSQSGRNSVVLIWLIWLIWVLLFRPILACFSVGSLLKETIKKHNLISYSSYTGLYNLISPFSFFFFLPLFLPSIFDDYYYFDFLFPSSPFLLLLSSLSPFSSSSFLFFL